VIDIAICGIRGRMGTALVELARGSDDLRVRAGIDRAGIGRDAAALGVDRVGGTAEAVRLLDGVDVVIDFSTAAATRTLLEQAADALAGRALVIGTTGLDDDTQRLLDDLADRSAVLTSANFSIGVNLLLSVCEQLGAVLPAHTYDAEVVETHHGGKRDAPSGTALALAGAIARGRGRALDDVRRDGRTGDTGGRPAGEIGLHAIRGGGVIGEHSVQFLGARESIELRHHALERSLFAEGALVAARWLHGRGPGRYTMRDVLDIQLGLPG
jgi:4-hydroxy-tetrahydrodipicolinate reductase